MDEIYYKTPNILCLSGITMEDYIPLEDVADERLITDEETMEMEVIYPYNKIPQIFTGIDKWISNTNLCCWSCSFKFNTVPKFVPVYIRESNDNIEIGVLGNMCTFNCSESWIESHYSNREERYKLQNNLCYLYFLFTGKRISHIKPSPCKTNLLQYGGNWNEETFLKKMKELEHE